MITQELQVHSPDKWASLGEWFSLQQSEKCLQAVLGTLVRHNGSSYAVRNTARITKLTPWSSAILEKPPVVQLLKNGPAYYGT
jgi:hypothetical protein